MRGGACEPDREIGRAGCGHFAGRRRVGARSSSATTVSVTAGKRSGLRFALSKKTVPKGSVTFKVANRGTLSHDFKIAGKKTKLLAKGKSATLTASFPKAGKYAFLCTVRGHAAGGMKGVLTVTG
jgi:uncharacterized cupredoxin-like copper-binding protein